MASSLSASSRAWGFTVIMALSLGPFNDPHLYDASANLIQTGTLAQITAAAAALAAANGWYIDLGANGEKGLSRSLTIDGTVYFTTFSPDTAVSSSMCEPPLGTGLFYALNLFDASEVHDFNDDSNYERFWTMGSLLPETPSPHFGSDGEIRLLLPPGAGGGSGGLLDNPFETGATLPAPYGSYWYQEDY